MAKGETHSNWEKENVKRIVIKIRNDDPILKAMDDAISSGFAETQTALIRAAIREWLDKYLDKQ